LANTNISQDAVGLAANNDFESQSSFWKKTHLTLFLIIFCTAASAGISTKKQDILIK